MSFCCCFRGRSDSSVEFSEFNDEDEKKKAKGKAKGKAKKVNEKVKKKKSVYDDDFEEEEKEADSSEEEEDNKKKAKKGKEKEKEKEKDKGKGKDSKGKDVDDDDVAVASAKATNLFGSVSDYMDTPQESNQPKTEDQGWTASPLSTMSAKMKEMTEKEKKDGGGPSPLPKFIMNGTSIITNPKDDEEKDSSVITRGKNMNSESNDPIDGVNDFTLESTKTGVIKNVLAAKFGGKVPVFGAPMPVGMPKPIATKIDDDEDADDGYASDGNDKEERAPGEIVNVLKPSRSPRARSPRALKKTAPAFNFISLPSSPVGNNSVLDKIDVDAATDFRIANAKLKPNNRSVASMDDIVVANSAEKSSTDNSFKNRVERKESIDDVGINYRNGGNNNKGSSGGAVGGIKSNVEKYNQWAAQLQKNDKEPSKDLSLKTPTASPSSRPKHQHAKSALIGPEPDEVQLYVLKMEQIAKEKDRIAKENAMKALYGPSWVSPDRKAAPITAAVAPAPKPDLSRPQTQPVKARPRRSSADEINPRLSFTGSTKMKYRSPAVPPPRRTGSITQSTQPPQPQSPRNPLKNLPPGPPQPGDAIRKLLNQMKQSEEKEKPPPQPQLSQQSSSYYRDNPDMVSSAATDYGELEASSVRSPPTFSPPPAASSTRSRKPKSTDISRSPQQPQPSSHKHNMSRDKIQFAKEAVPSNPPPSVNPTKVQMGGVRPPQNYGLAPIATTIPRSITPVQGGVGRAASPRLQGGLDLSMGSLPPPPPGFHL